ncbi:MAG: amidase domain-containing protein, partial [Peptidiphaga gingivicola]
MKRRIRHVSAIASFLSLISVAPAVADVGASGPVSSSAGKSIGLRVGEDPTPAPGNSGNSAGSPGDSQGGAEGSQGNTNTPKRSYGVRGYLVTRKAPARSIAGFKTTRDSYRFAIDGREYTLEATPQYTNPSAALARFKTTHAASIAKIRAHFKLPDLSEQTATQYVNALSDQVMAANTPVSSDEIFAVADFSSTLAAPADNAKTEQVLPKLVYATKTKNVSAIIRTGGILDSTIPAASKKNVALTQKLDSMTGGLKMNPGGSQPSPSATPTSPDGSQPSQSASPTAPNGEQPSPSAAPSNPDGSQPSQSASPSNPNGEQQQTSPSTTPAAPTQPQTKKLTVPNVDAAVAYAKKYAFTPNTQQYKYFEHADCTNFASQILAAGGQPTDAYWHPHPWGNSTRHTYSWAVANAFARHWGLNQGTTSWTEFASRVHRGSFVALAYSNGKVYHTAFVTEQADVVSDEYGTYRTFAIAQHTRNYEGWVHGNGLASVWKQRGYWITAEGEDGLLTWDLTEVPMLQLLLGSSARSTTFQGRSGYERAVE